VDEKIGELLAALDARGVLRDTLVVFTSDHGESLGEHGFWMHRGCLFREQIRVPLVLWAPGLVPVRRVDVPVSNVSLAATLVERLGLDARGLSPVPSLVPLLRAPADAAPPDWPDPIAEIARHPWSEYRSRPVFRGDMRVLVHGSWHLIRHETDGEQ